MRDTCQPFRKAVYDCLVAGNILWNGNAVPIYDEKTKVANTDPIFIILSTQQETDIDGNDSVWITRSAIDVEVVAKTANEVSKNIIDAIANQIVNLVIPTRGTIGIAQPSGFQVVLLVRESSLTQTLAISQTESVLVKIVKFVAEFVEQT